MTRSILLVCVAGFPTLSSECYGQDANDVNLREYVIFEGDPPAGEADTRPASARTYKPYFIQPAAKGSDIAINTAFPVESGGTCLELIGSFAGANEFFNVSFTPEGETNLASPACQPVDILTQLGPGRNQRVFLELKARRAPASRAIVGFRVGGLAAGANRDGIRPSLAGEKKFHVLTPEFQTYRIPIPERKLDGLKSVLCPLAFVVESNSHPGQPEVTFYVDDVRFIAVD